MLEWSAALGTWSLLDPSGYIEDPALAVPLPIEAMVSDDKTDDTIARALLAKRNPVLMQNVAESRAQGKAEGLAKAVIVVLTARGVVPDDATRARILGERDEGQLERWIACAPSCATLAELLAEP